MASCEWNPAGGGPAYEDRGCPNEATTMVGYNGAYHLCDSCAALPFFDRYKVRRPLKDGSSRLTANQEGGT